MAKYKGVPLVFLRRRVRESGLEPEVLEALAAGGSGSDDVRLWERLTATEWVPVDFAERVYEVAIPLVYATDAMPFRRFGIESAEDDLRGVYRFLVRLMTVGALIDKTVTLWRTYHDQGRASSERLSDRSFRMAVDGYPELVTRLSDSWQNPTGPRRATQRHSSSKYLWYSSSSFLDSHADGSPGFTTHCCSG